MSMLPGSIVPVPVVGMYWQQVGDGVAVGVAVAVGVGVDAPDCAQYFPPVFDTKGSWLIPPPQRIISLPFQTAV